MEKFLFIITVLQVSTALAQSSTDSIIVDNFSNCIETALEAEKKKEKPNLESIQAACDKEYQALMSILSPDVKVKIGALLNKGLQRDLQR